MAKRSAAMLRLHKEIVVLRHGLILTGLCCVGLALFGVTFSSDDSPTVTTVIAVRHAEKVDDSRDPELSDAGRERAKALAWVLRDVHFDAAFSTDLHRTKDTLRRLLDAQPGLELDVKTPPNALAKRILSQHRGQTVIVAGHSNTVPELVRSLGADFEPELLEAYDNLMIVTITGDGDKPVARLTRLHYPGKRPD